MAKLHKTCMEQAENIDTFGTYQVSTPRGIYRRRGASGGHPGQPGGCLERPPFWAAPAALLADWWWSRPSALIILESSDAEIFNIFFMEFFGHFNPPENLKNKNSRKQELATGCTKLIS